MGSSECVSQTICEDNQGDQGSEGGTEGLAPGNVQVPAELQSHTAYVHKSASNNAVIG